MYYFKNYLLYFYWLFKAGDENLYVPIHAYPILSSFEFPTNYKFPNLALGKSLTRSFNLRSSAPIEFEYMIEILEKNPAFRIEPLQGVIPFNRDATINVTFTPKEFCTAVMTLQLIISQFNSKPIVCTFYGTSTPGLARDEMLNKFSKLAKIPEKKIEEPVVVDDEDDIFNEYKDDDSSNSKSSMNDSRLASPNVRSALKQTNLKELTTSSKDVAIKHEQFVDYEGYRIPVNLNNPWAISKVLIQTKGKLSLKDLKSSAKNSSKISAQAKEALFLQKVNELEDEERKNQLKWQVKLGESPVDPETREDILLSRARAYYEYQLSIGVPFLENEINRQKTVEFECRIVRDYKKLGRSDITFDTFKNQIWQLRFMALDNFIQAVRKVIVKNRLLKCLKLIKKFIDSWNDALNDSELGEDIKLNIENYIDIYTRRSRGENEDQNHVLRTISSKTMGTYYFPQIVEFKEFQDQKAKHCEKISSITKLESLGLVAVRPIDFQVQQETPYVNLAIPVLYKLNTYKAANENFFVPKHEGRLMKLRSGAEDELTQIDSAAFENTPVLKSKAKNEIQLTQILDLNPSKELTQPSQFHPLHVFNPVPGLISYQKLLPYSGVDLNHHLNPLPRFERDQAFSTQKKFLEREDVIKGVMAWKKFPSQGLISLTNTPTITDVWVPRWSDPFGTDLLPTETPQLLSGLPEDDKKNLAGESDEDQVSVISKDASLKLTPEMVNSQFNLPDIFEIRERNAREESQFPYGDKIPSSNMPVSLYGQVSRDQREQELEFFINKQYNTIGMKIQNKLASVDQQFSPNPTISINSAKPSNSASQQQNQSNLNIRSAATISSALISNSATTLN
ncbi:unnamed protein product [Brachionus calyciflorus]|uniref:Uncharacterized protein n=1 Tax=Brachionus calyciflorus TaxID=104777 RepID=A0A813M8P3_9BILA|nr:unnamed protein product [Brachionus calyciflorus]